ncbi:nucleoside triphosphate pyrophosphatase [Spirochaetia bacterium 38H-sp]|uniref:dTTP/UTP pyrophosphatase n=1 Tax=Rarispira pelagica TaxID=3141764 RepID=A0ABU9UBY9_9SPIR
MLLLASNSPRRAELLKKTGIEFYQWAPDYDEFFPNTEDIRDAAIELSKNKLQQVMKYEITKKFALVLTADTIIEINGMVLGKPENKKEAKRFLSLLSGKEHRVITSLCLYNKENSKIISDAETTYVKFSSLSDEEIESYTNTKEWRGAAGAYRIQGMGELFIEWIKGTYSCVMGLPLSCFYGILRKINFPYRKIFRPLDE